ncbi:MULTISPECIES: MaoC/PaaZ C-terminal domain-containing protein [unclassified Rathayibacter]|uniref:MaoC/PaaZ C-terminal domain-containing protein n=1 Tax=unclassified Rathayibacter TaxID=2609250 RepID=UPI000F475445|nr:MULTISPECIES: MaoC/PaaZ C-terminal domain-containing protein [unclassified Rathayibacter]
MGDFDLPLADRYFDNYLPGIGGILGRVTATEKEIVTFATALNPHTMHTDPEAARLGDFGGVIASGWHTTAIIMRLLVDHFPNERASVASPGVEELRWQQPVRPRDTLGGRFVVLSARPSASRPDRGLARIGIELLDQHDTAVISHDHARPPPAPPAAFRSELILIAPPAGGSLAVDPGTPRGPLIARDHIVSPPGDETPAGATEPP